MSLHKSKIKIVLFLISNFSLSAQSIFSEDYKSQADVKVYVVDYKSEADLAVFKVEYKSQSKGNNGLWYFVNYRSQSEKSIFFVEYKSQADLLIYFVDYKSQAGWINNKLKHLMF
jgi:hypothetical protein